MKDKNLDKSRKFIIKSDLALIAGIIISAIVLWVGNFYYNNNGNDVTAVIYHDGEVYNKVNLTKSKDIVIKVEGTRAVLEIKGHKIAFITADCPNKICEHSGFIGRGGQTAVCVPNKVAVSLTSKEQETDILAY